MAPTTKPDRDADPQWILSFGVMALQALDPRFTRIIQMWKVTESLLEPLSTEIKRQIEIRQDAEPDPSLLPELGNHIAQVSQIVAECDPNTIAGQIKALKWVDEGLEQLLQNDGEIPDLQRLQTLVTLLGMVNNHFKSHP